MADIYVYMIEMPSDVDEAVMPCMGGYTVYINANLTRERQEQAYLHALGHINAGDDNINGNVDEIELRAHAEERDGDGEEKRRLLAGARARSY